MIQIKYRLWLLPMLLSSLNYMLYAQDTICDPVQSATYSAALNRSGDYFEIATRSIITSDNQLAVAGYMGDQPSSSSFLPFFQILDESGTPVIDPQVIDLGGGLLNGGIQPFELQGETQLIEVRDASGAANGYLLAYTVSGAGTPNGASDIILVRLDSEGCPLWIRMVGDESDIEVPIGLFQEASGGFTLFISSLINPFGDGLSIVSLDEFGAFCSRTKIEEISGGWQPMAVKKLESPLNAFAEYAVLSNQDRNGKQFGIALLDPALQLLDGIIPYFDMDIIGEDQSELAYDFAQDAGNLIVIGTFGAGTATDLFVLNFDPLDPSGAVSPIVNQFFTYSTASSFEYPSNLIVDPLTHDITIAYNVENPSDFTTTAHLMKIDEFGFPYWVRTYENSETMSTFSLFFGKGPDNTLANIGAHIDTVGGYSSWIISSDEEGQLGNCECYEETDIDIGTEMINQLTEEGFSEQLVCNIIPVPGFCETYMQEVTYCDRTPLLPEICELDYCLTDSFNLNTGMNKADGTLYPFGTYDPFWRFISGPIPGLSTHPAYVIEPNPAWAPLLDTTLEQARYLSFIPYESFTINNPPPQEPYIFQNCFCVCDDSTEVTIEMTLSSDDFAEVYLCDENNNLIDTILIADTTTNYAFQEPLTTDTLVTTLDAGTYCIKVELRNLGGVAMGFGVVGSVKGANIISELCCNNGSAIVGAKYHDLNCDGERAFPNDPNAPEHEPGLPSWGIVLCDSLGNPLDTTYTDTLGYYSFEFLMPGKYRVKELLQTDWEATTPVSPDYWEITLDSIDVEGFVDFGNKYTGPLAFRDTIECAKRGSRNPITWEGGDCDCPVNIDLVNCATGAISSLASGLPNTGVFYWNVPAGFPIGDYQIVITNCDGSDVLSSDCFPIRDCCCGDVYPNFSVSQSCDGIIVTPNINDDCFQYYWNWGDGGSEEGPYTTGTTISHDYSTPGAYFVCLRLEEFDDFGEFCREIEQCRLIFFEGCPPECDSLEVEANPIDISNNQCCWSLSYTNTYPDSVYGIEILLPGGATLQYDPTTDIAAPFNRFTYSNQHVLLVNDNFDPLPAGSITDFFSFCVAGVSQTPQQLIINWYDENFNIVCDEILLLDCQPETEECLYILTDTLICDTAGYKYIATVKNPQGSGFDVGRIKLNVLNPTGGIMVPDSIIDLSPPLGIGDTLMIMFLIETDDDLAGEDFCFLLSAHDGPDEMLCCAEIEKCIPFPQCDPCEYVDVMAMPLDTIVEGDCCYTFTVKNGYFDPMYFTGLEVNILNPGVSFSGIDLPLPPSWWYIQNGPGQLEWTHFSGFIPVDTVDVFDFCLEGVTTTDSVYIEVNWLQGDSVICYDTLAVFCPECIVITEEDIECQADGTYKYTFNFTNLNDLNVPVNAIKIIDTTGYVIMPDSGEYLLLPTPVPYGQTSTSDPMIIIDAPDSLDNFYFKMVMVYLDEDSINVECCYVEHCIELPPCEDPCPQFACVPPDDWELSCSDLPPGIDYNDPFILQQFFGEPMIIGDCPDLTWIELPPQLNLDDCGGGVILRFFQVVDGAGNTSELCVQTIQIFESHQYKIRFPADRQSACDDINDIDDLLLIESACDFLAVTYTDEFITPTGGGCLLIERRYDVINWCLFDGQSGPVVISRDEDCDGIPGDEDVWVNVLTGGITYIDRNDEPFDLNPAAGEKGNSCDGLTNFSGYWINTTEGPGATPPRDLTDVGYWQYTQIIEIFDNTAPIVEADTALTFCSFDNINCTADIELPFSVVDDCFLGELIIQVQYDENNNGTIDSDVSDMLSGTAPDYIISGTYPIGSHRFIIIAEDACGNITSFSLPFEVVDCAPPDIICQTTVVVQLLPVTPPSDVDGDGDIDVASATVAADVFIEGTLFDCTGQGPNGEITEFSINFSGEPINPSQDVLVLTCDEVGLVQVEVHAYDGAGNSNTCLTSILVQDNIGLCGPVVETPVFDQLQAYPNPTKGVIHLLPPLGGNYLLEAFDARGTLIVSRSLEYRDGQPVTLDVEEWSDGLYFFKLSHSNGEVYESKAVKAR